MIPFRPLPERVFAVIWKLDELRHQTSEYEVRVDYAQYARLAAYQPAAIEPGPVGGFRLFEMPVVPDHTLKRGEVVVRHEVEA